MHTYKGRLLYNLSRLIPIFKSILCSSLIEGKWSPRRKTTSFHCISTSILMAHKSTIGLQLVTLRLQLVSFTCLLQYLIRLYFTSYTSHVAINAYAVKSYLLSMHKGSQSNQIMSCTSIIYIFLPKQKIFVRGSISSSLKG